MEPLLFIGLIISICVIALLILFYIISPMSFYDLLRINYYLCYITENGTVIKRLIQRVKGQWFLVWNKRAFLIPFGSMVKYKNGNVFYADAKNAFSIKMLSKEQEEKYKEIKSYGQVKGVQKARAVLQKIPIVNMFYMMKKDIINEIVFANRFILNPDFIVDSAQFYIMLTQDITKKILAKPKNLMDVIGDNLPLIICAVVAIVIGIMWMQGNRGTVQA